MEDHEDELKVNDKFKKVKFKSCVRSVTEKPVLIATFLEEVISY